jgi:hypothetical protein
VLGGLYAACSASGDLMKIVALPLLNEAASFLGEHLPTTDVAQVEMEAIGATADGAKEIREFFDRAGPLVTAGGITGEKQFLLVPASVAGKALGEEACRVLPQLQVVRVFGQAHLLFCREQAYLSSEDLQHRLQPCREAYEEAVLGPQSSPHARFDIIDWMPLDP